MRLRRIEAVRYGALESVSLGDLGEGLSVVLGPNEAGKSTFTALVRAVLFGYPKRSESEPGYESAAGKREGRLVFVGDGGEWVLERIEGPHGGPLSVHTVSGPDRPDLHKTLTAGVSREAYRVAFGFGLAEMAEIESTRSTDDVLSRLYAAGAGLAVNPQDVRAALQREAEVLFKPRGSAPRLNDLKSRMSELRREVRALEDRAADFASEREHLAGLERQTAETRAERDALAASATRLETLAARLAELESRRAELAEQLAREQAALEDTATRLESTVPDDRVLSVAPELQAVLEDLSGFRARLDALAAHEAAIQELRPRIADALASTGLSEERAGGIDTGPETDAGLEQWRDTLARVESLVESAAEALTSAEVALAAASPGPGAARPSAAGAPLPWYVAIAVGLVAVAAGVLLRQYVAAVAGAVFALLGIGGAALARRGGPAQSMGAGASIEALAQAERAARELSARRASEREARLEEWRAWLDERGLGQAGEHPRAVADLVRALKEWKLARTGLDARIAQRDREEQSCREYADRLARAASGFLAVDPTDLQGVHADAARVRAELEQALATRASRDSLRDHLAAQQALVADIQARLDSLDAEIAGAFDPSQDRVGSLEMQARAAIARAELDAVDARLSDLVSQVGVVRGELGVIAEENRMGELRLEITGVRTALESSAEEYAALAVAVRLLEIAQERHEQTRQPEVVRIAGDEFRRITSGRYERIAVPAGGGQIKVFDAASSVKTSEQLSRGTREQLYLALRIGLLRHLGEVGAALPVLMDDILVNFDPGRREGAARAIAGLASGRQVVVFTCHPETVELFADVAPDHTLITLDRC